MNFGPHPHLVIPSEIQVREFDSKLLLACAAAERGYKTIVGSRIDIHNRILSLPRGTYVAKDAAPTSCRMFGILKGLGYSIVGWDEEASVYYSIEQFLRKRTCPCTVSRLSTYFTWGESQREAFSKVPMFAGIALHPTGNPRIDMLRPELRSFYAEEVVALRQRFGRMILVNTNFGRLNHFLPERKLTPSAPGELAYRNLREDDISLDVWQFQEKVFRHFQTMLPSLAKAFPNHTILLRPHPAEDQALWVAAAVGMPNVRVLHEGSVVPWLMAAEVLIHNGCTTGIEGYLLDRPVVAYRPVQDPSRELMLPNSLSTSVASVDELISIVGDILAGNHHFNLTPEVAHELEQHISGLSGKLVSDRVLDVIDHLGEKGLLVSASTIKDRASAYGRGALRTAAKTLQAFLPLHKNSARNRMHRFPGIDLPEVEARIRRLRKSLGRFSEVEVRSINRNIFEVHRR